MITRYVIAGTHQEYEEYWRSKTSNYEIKYVYVHDASVLIGVENPHGVFIGSWIKHPHIDTILTNLLVYSKQHNPSLDRVLQIRNQT